MSEKDVSPEMVKALIKQADERNIFTKAKLVAKEIGLSKGASHGVHLNFNDGPLYIWFDDYGSNLNIKWNDETVFSVQLGDKIWSYRPSVGPWEEALNTLYKTAQDIHNLKAGMVAKKEQEERNRAWG